MQTTSAAAEPHMRSGLPMSSADSAVPAQRRLPATQQRPRLARQARCRCSVLPSLTLLTAASCAVSVDGHSCCLPALHRRLPYPIAAVAWQHCQLWLACVRCVVWPAAPPASITGSNITAVTFTATPAAGAAFGTIRFASAPPSLPLDQLAGGRAFALPSSLHSRICGLCQGVQPGPCHEALPAPQALLKPACTHALSCALTCACDSLCCTCKRAARAACRGRALTGARCVTK